MTNKHHDLSRGIGHTIFQWNTNLENTPELPTIKKVINL
jgi:hypothetical protein